MRISRFLPLLAALLTALWMVPVAFAHAHYVSSTPAGGANLASAPSSISITYDDVLDPNATTIAVLGPNGQSVTAGKTVVTIEATKVATVAIGGAGNGVYTVKWHAVADDDKGVTEGSFIFSVGTPAATVAGATTTVVTAATTTMATTALSATIQPALPASGGGGMAVRSAELQAALSLAAALLVAVGVALGIARRAPGR